MFTGLLSTFRSEVRIVEWTQEGCERQAVERSLTWGEEGREEGGGGQRSSSTYEFWGG